jgi:hypothetical protein
MSNIIFYRQILLRGSSNKYQNLTTYSRIEVRRNQKRDQKDLAFFTPSINKVNPDLWVGRYFESCLLHNTRTFCLAASFLERTNVKDTKLHGQVVACIRQKCQQDVGICIAALDHTGIIFISFVHSILGYTFSCWALLQFSTYLVGGLDVSCTIAPNHHEARSKHNSVAKWGTRHPCQFTHSTVLSVIRWCCCNCQNVIWR